MQKKIVVIKSDGTETVLSAVPNRKQITAIIGGYMEFVTVLAAIVNHQGIYCPMIVNEEGVLNDLPRNEKATALYQNNVRAAFPHSDNPFKATKEEHQAKWRKIRPDMVFIDNDSALPNYNPDDPHIAGDVIYFQGYTAEEVDNAITPEEVTA